jgi:hypothetical protein
MTQPMFNSGQFRHPANSNAAKAVSLLDAPPAVMINRPAPRHAWWPIVAIAFGGLVTLVWGGFLLWQVARVVLLLVATET